MVPVEEIIDTIPKLSREEKLRVRSVIDTELQPPPVSPKSGKHASRLIGLFADEPELIDAVLEAAYEQRALPLRTPETQE